MRLFCLLLGFSILTSAFSQPTNLSRIKQISPGVFEIGQVRLDKQARAVSFPAVINMTNAIIEYVAVTENGKTHESLLRTDAQPKDIHVAMLLLDAKGAGTNVIPEDPSKPIPGDPVTIEVTWKEKGREKRVRVEEMVYNTVAKTNLAIGPWIYTGSLVENGKFMADADGSVISLITDPGALVNNPRPGRENDDLCEANSPRVPPLDTPVVVRMTLQTPASKPK